MNVLGIESSCDETAAAVVGPGPRILSDVVHSQVSVHAPFGGVVPEVASREHVARMMPLVQRAVQEAGVEINAVAATSGPGLVGPLLVGVQFAKGFAYARGIPWIGINHLEGHLAAALLGDEPVTYPHIALVVSGGHSHLYAVHAFGEYKLLGGTRDDAAGEAFDKVAKLLGLGYPGGVKIQQTAQGGDPHAIDLPRSIPQKSSFDFSFSGLKTAASAYVKEHGGTLDGQLLQDFCASLQEAIADVLVQKTLRAAQSMNYQHVVLAGGVSANARLRELVVERASKQGIQVLLPPKKLCTDNAAMIAAAGWMRLRQGEQSGWDVNVRSRWPLDRSRDARSVVGQVK